MPPKSQRDYYITLVDSSHFAALVHPEGKKLSVVDVHLPWCGPCNLMCGTYRSIALRIDEWEHRLQFLVADTDKVKELAEKQTSCMPKFLFYVGSKLVAEVEGVDVPQISTFINKYMPSLEDA